MKSLKMLLMAILMLIPIVVVAQNNSYPVVEVIYFHGPQRCKTCVELEKVAKETVNIKFGSQVKSGKVSFKTVDVGTSAGEQIADKYEVAWSALIIVRKDGKKEKYVDLTKDGFKYAVKDPDKLKGIIANQINTYLK